MSHGKVIGQDVLAPHSKSYQGPFGRMFPNLAPWSTGMDVEKEDKYFANFAATHMEELPNKAPEDIAASKTTINTLEKRFNSSIPAGYTYFGQFVDHDITLDHTSLGQRQVDPNKIMNFRTPRLDLDCVYGRGPEDQPYLYDQNNPGKFLIGDFSLERRKKHPDLPRNQDGQALISDKRNDENAIISQIQLAFLLAHNELVDRAKGTEEPFYAARKTLTRLYQWVVWHDYLERITLDCVHSCALSLEDKCGGRKVWEQGLSDIYKWKHQPFMPVEFSGAAYRFGHSMVRNSYQTNNDQARPIFSTGCASSDLRGFRTMIAENIIQWNRFLEMDSTPQMARKIDTKLSNALTHLPFAGNAPNNVLAFRNLKRGVNLGLPSGIDVAERLGIEPIDLNKDEPESLWFYVLKEAEEQTKGMSLGSVGSVIVCAVFSGLLKGDPCSFFNNEPEWHPNTDPLLMNGKDNEDDSSWTLASIIRLSGLPVDASGSFGEKGVRFDRSLQEQIDIRRRFGIGTRLHTVRPGALTGAERLAKIEKATLQRRSRQPRKPLKR